MSEVVGYARVSTAGQSLDVQLDSSLRQAANGSSPKSIPEGRPTAASSFRRALNS